MVTDLRSFLQSYWVDSGKQAIADDILLFLDALKLGVEREDQLVDPFEELLELLGELGNLIHSMIELITKRIISKSMSTIHSNAHPTSLHTHHSFIFKIHR